MSTLTKSINEMTMRQQAQSALRPMPAKEGMGHIASGLRGIGFAVLALADAVRDHADAVRSTDRRGSE